MQKNDEELRSSGAADGGKRGPIEPRVTVGEEIILLALHHKSNAAEEVAGLWFTAYEQPGGYRDAVATLEAAGLVERHGLMRHPQPTAEAQIDARTQRLVRAIQSAAALADEDADLLVGVAACGALQLGASDYTAARHRIASLGQETPQTVFLRLFCECNGISSAVALADAVLPLGREADTNPGPATAAIASNLGRNF